MKNNKAFLPPTTDDLNLLLRSENNYPFRCDFCGTASQRKTGICHFCGYAFMATTSITLSRLLFFSGNDCCQCFNYSPYNQSFLRSG